MRRIWQTDGSERMKAYNEGVQARSEGERRSHTEGFWRI